MNSPRSPACPRKEHWGEAARSLPAPPAQASAARRAKPEPDPRPAVILEISANRNAPHEQEATLIIEHGAK